MIVPFRQQAVTFWEKQSKPQRVTLIVLALAVIIIVPLLITWSSTPSYAVVFSGLSETDAGQIVEKLKEGNIPYQLKNAGTVMVPSAQVYEVRLMMARQGIPASSTVGYEIFDQTSLGMNEFTQKVNYQRALEGELEKTIVSLDSIENVRVHIVTPEKSIFSKDQQDPTASVTLKVKVGKRVDASQVSAITHLVANSIEGMKAEKVVVVDTNGKMLTNTAEDNGVVNNLTQADNQHQVEQQTAQTIQQKVQTMLDSVLGPNKSTVQAAVVMDWSQRETTSQTFSPTPAAVRSSHKVNEAYTLGGTTGGIPGASSNLPTPVATVVVNGSNTLYTKNEETMNYELTQTQLKEIVTPGQIKRVSVSVMVDGISDPAQMTGLKNAVAAAAGIDTTRGDTVAVESMAFDHSFADKQATAQSAADQTNLYYKMAEIGAGVLGVLAMVGIILWLFSKLRKSAGEQWRPVMRPVNAMALAAALAGSNHAMLQAPTGEAVPSLNANNEAMAAAAATSAQQVQQRIMEMATKNTLSAEDEQIQKMMTQITDDNPATVAEIIQMWLNEG